MIIVVEGPTAAGKTTWAMAHAGRALVPEAIPAAEPPLDPREAARFWAENGAVRWQQAVATEQRAGFAVCDTDPLKLHYSWSLWRIGVGSESAFRQKAGAYREMVAQSRIGLADAYFVSIAGSQTLEGRRSQDTTRRRRNFSLHARLGEPLREWYAALEEVRPGSVRWSFPDEGIGAHADESGARYDLEGFDALVRRVAG
ncbi:MAG: hypothetical protein ACRDG7_10850 [Candidatus Limnocylindria bacterium]